MGAPANWPPELEAAYQKWLQENEQTCLCLTCLNARLRQARRAIARKDPK